MGLVKIVILVGQGSKAQVRGVDLTLDQVQDPDNNNEVLKAVVHTASKSRVKMLPAHPQGIFQFGNRNYPLMFVDPLAEGLYQDIRLRVSVAQHFSQALIGEFEPLFIDRDLKDL